MLNQITLACYTQGHGNQFINSEAWSIPELYCSFIKDLDTGKVVKVNINIRAEWGDLLDYYENYVDVITIRNHFDFSAYLNLNNLDKKKMQLEAVHSGMMQIAEKEGWNIDPLLDAYSKCLKNNLEYQFDIGKLKTSPNRKYKIGFWCNWDIDVFELYWVLYDKNNNEIKRQKLLEKPPYEGEFVYYTKWKWLDNSKVLLEDKYKYGKNETWEISLQ